MNIQVKVIPKHNREFLQMALDIIKEGKQEDGCLAYQLHKDMEEENTYNIETKWESEMQA